MWSLYASVRQSGRRPAGSSETPTFFLVEEHLVRLHLVSRRAGGNLSGFEGQEGVVSGNYAGRTRGKREKEPLICLSRAVTSENLSFYDVLVAPAPCQV